jgi:hypothetical protein
MPNKKKTPLKNINTDLLQLAKKLAPISDHIRGPEPTVELKVAVPKSLAERIARIVQGELQRDARIQALYRHAERAQRCQRISNTSGSRTSVRI